MTDQREGGIAWTDFTTNPLRYRTADGRTVWACEKISAGCANCYAESLSARFSHLRAGDWNAGTMAGLTPYLDEKELRTLLTSKKISGKRVFVGDMTDVLGEWVPDELLDRLFAVFATRSDVTFQVLTKRPERMAAYLSHRDCAQRVAEDAMLWHCKRTFDPDKAEPDWTAEDAENYIPSWPLKNVWLGFSAENQETFNARYRPMAKLADAGWTTFCSAEPLLGPIDMTSSESPKYLGSFVNALESREASLSWVIVGGESGHNARSCRVEWIESIIRQCQAAGVPAFNKQLGALSGIPMFGMDKYEWVVNVSDKKGGDPSEWPEALRVRQFPEDRL
jgi:protein gp37